MKLIVVFLIFSFSFNLGAQWNNGQNAEYVIGQSDFISNNSGTTASSFSLPYDVAFDIYKGKMYVVDLANHRVLRFNYPVKENNPEAEIVFGQMDFFGKEANQGVSTSKNTLFFPTAVAVYEGCLWICDQGNNRILKFNNASDINENGIDADAVLGQVDFVTNTPGTSNLELSNPYDITFDNNGNLWVADQGNNRVLKFDEANSKVNGGYASLVLGQPDFLSSLSATSQTGMKNPTGVVCFEGNLFVADMGNNRVLRFDNVWNKDNGDQADMLLGQINFTSGLSNRGGAADQKTLSSPFKVETDSSGRLYIADQSNNRYLVFQGVMNKQNGGNADWVLGQSDFISTGSEITENGMNFCNGSAIDVLSDKILITDEENNRVLQFAANTSLKYFSPESVTFDRIRNVYIVSNAGDGKLISVFENGNIAYFNEQSSNTSIRGITIFNDILYAATSEGIKLFDLTNGYNIATYKIDEALFLNDIIVDKDGNIFVSDNEKKKIYKLNSGSDEFEVFTVFSNEHPNGLCLDYKNNRLISVMYDEEAAIKSIDLNTGNISTIVKTKLDYLDGIVMDNLGNYYVSAWGQSGVYRFNQDFTTEPKLFINNLYGPADLYFNEEKSRLVIPEMGANKVGFFEVPNIKIVSPDGGEKIKAGTEYTIKWQSKDIDSFVIEYSQDNGIIWNKIADLSVPDTDSFDWLVPGINSEECLLKVSDKNHTELFDISDSLFIIGSFLKTDDNDYIVSGNWRNFQNPVINEIILKYEIYKNGKIDFKIRDSYGKEVINIKDLSGNIGKHEERINCSDLQEGLYFCEFAMKSSKIITVQRKKIIKLR